MTPADLNAHYLKVSQERDELQSKIAEISTLFRNSDGQEIDRNNPARSEYSRFRQELRRLNDRLRLLRQYMDSNPVLDEK